VRLLWSSYRSLCDSYRVSTIISVLWIRRIRKLLASWVRISIVLIYGSIRFPFGIRIPAIYHRYNKISEKVPYFIVFNDLLPFWQHFFSNARRNFQMESRSSRILKCLASRIRIRKSGLRIRGPGKNIYGSYILRYVLHIKLSQCRLIWLPVYQVNKPFWYCCWQHFWCPCYCWRPCCCWRPGFS
jgi:hypothetical protein